MKLGHTTQKIKTDSLSLFNSFATVSRHPPIKKTVHDVKHRGDRIYISIKDSHLSILQLRMHRRWFISDATRDGILSIIDEDTRWAYRGSMDGTSRTAPPVINGKRCYLATRQPGTGPRILWCCSITGLVERGVLPSDASNDLRFSY